MKRLLSAALAAAVFLAFCVPRARCGGAEKGCIALTFDDGPSGELTEALLDGLHARGVRATFFVCAYRVAQFPQTLCRAAQEGHEIGLHSCCHDYMQNMCRDEAYNDLVSCAQAVTECCGLAPRLFRPPGGLYSSDLLAAAKDAGVSVILWSVDPEDWKYRNSDTVYNNIVKNAYDGCIILCHDVYKTTVNGALRAIDTLQSQGYEFVTVEQLLTRRGITPENGVVYYDAKNTGINLPAGVAGSEYYDESKLEEHWGYNALMFCLDHGYLERDADGSVLPNHKITRGDFVAALGRFCGISSSYRRQRGSALSDVSSSDANKPYIEWANDIGLMTGYDGKFRPDDSLTREEMATVVTRYLVMRGKASADGSIDGYKDAARISRWAADGVGLCTKLGILKGSKGYFMPKQPLTRAQTAAVLQRLSAY